MADGATEFQADLVNLQRTCGAMHGRCAHSWSAGAGCVGGHWLFGARFYGAAVPDLVAGMDDDLFSFGQAVEHFGFEAVVVADL